MKKFLNLKSFLLAVLATLAVNVMASNKTNEEPTICQQWEVEDIATFSTTTTHKWKSTAVWSLT